MNPILGRVREVLEELERRGSDPGLSQQLLWKWKNDDGAVPSSESLARLAFGSGVNGHWLLTGQGEKYAMVKGADAAFARGVEEGYARAIQWLRQIAAIEAGRATSAAASETVGDRADLIDVLAKEIEQGREKPAQTAKPRRQARGGRRT